MYRKRNCVENRLRSPKGVTVHRYDRRKHSLGKEDATDEEVAHAAQIAQATDFIERMRTVTTRGSNKVDRTSLVDKTTVVDCRGPRSSTGSICLLMIVFQRSTLKLMPHFEKALREETREATVLIVAQRVSTVIDADQSSSWMKESRRNRDTR